MKFDERLRSAMVEAEKELEAAWDGKGDGFPYPWLGGVGFGDLAARGKEILAERDTEGD